MLRAVIYCRCSTEEECQKDALSKQVQEAKECARKHNWILVEEYIESRSGTTTLNRTEYKRLIEDMERDLFDIIVIKSQDRLMRNTRDWYLFVDRLVVWQKKLYIYLEQKFYTTDDALITGIKAILAEEYSRELSKKINNAHRHRQKTGTGILLTSNAYGFRKNPEREIELIEEEAAVKRKMYRLCASGLGSRRIEAILKNEGIVKRNGTPFGANDILRMIKNPLNKGCVVMGRLHYDFDSKRTIHMPIEKQYIHEHRIPATVSDELWEAANEEIRKRRRRKPEEKASTGSILTGRNPGRYQLSGKLYCGLCGSPYYRRTRRRYKDHSYICEWKCKRYLETGKNTGCDNVHLDEEKLYPLLEENCMKSDQIDKENMIGKLTKILDKVLEEQNLQLEIQQKRQKKQKIEQQMQKLVDKLLDGILPDQMYQKKQKELEQQQNLVQEQLVRLEQEKKKLPKDRIKQIEDNIRKDNLMEKALVAQMLEKIDKITVYPTYMEVGEGIRIEYGNLFDYKKKKSQEREELVAFIKKNPNMTVEQMAEKLEIGLAAVRYRINVLKKEKKIRYHGAGGKGYWEVLE